MKWLKLILIALIAIGVIGAVAFYFLMPAATTLVAALPGGNTDHTGYVANQGNVTGNPVPHATSTISVPTAEMQVSPTELVKGFYAWYIGGLIDNYKFTASSEFIASAGNWLTPNLSTNWRDLAAREDANPFFLAQDYQDSWATDISASIKSQSATSTAVLVTLGDSGSNPQKVIAHLVSADGKWLIDSITSAQ